MTRLLAALVLTAAPVIVVPMQAGSFYRHNRSNGFMVSSGEAREYSLFVPRSYDPGRPTPLVISLHAAALWGAAQERISGWDGVAERERVIVAYPTAAGGGGPRVFRLDATPALDRDVRFIADLMDVLRARYNIDSKRIYVNGLSNGGGMAFALSCGLPDRFAAIGMVSAAQTLPWTWCGEPRPVAMIAFHGTDDRATPYAGGQSWVASLPFPNIPAWTANWARRNRCAPAPHDVVIAADVTRRAYADCADGADVELYTIRGGGHEWPGGGPLPEWLCGPFSHAVDATEVMWRFFRAHALR